MKAKLLLLMIMLVLSMGFFSGCTYDISGTVKEGDKPLPNVEINFSGGYSTATTDSNGRWVKSGLKGYVTVNPKLYNYSFDPEDRVVFGVDHAVNFAANYIGGYNASGIVTDCVSGKGVAGVKIKFNGITEFVETGTDGKWSKSNLAGTVEITPEKEGWSFEPSSITVTGESNTVNFSGTNSYDVCGVVTNATGQPLSDVIIEFSEGFQAVSTDSSGCWSKKGLTGQVRVTPKKVGYNFSPIYIDIYAASTAVDFQGFDSQSVSGRITDLRGNGIGGVKIVFSNSFFVETDSNGYWVTDTLAGTVTVTPQKSGYTFEPLFKSITVPGGNINFTATYTVSGKVIDAKNSGIAGVIICLGGGDAAVETDYLGNWSMNGLSGTITLAPSKNGYSFTPENQTVATPNTDVSFSGTYSVSGQVKDAQGYPISEVSISFGGVANSVQTNANGEWSQSGLSGLVTITPTKTGYSFTDSSKQVIGPSTGISFTGSYSASGQISDSQGNGISGVTLTFEGFGTTTSNTNGSWQKSGLSGSVKITPSKSGCIFTPQDTTVIGPSTSINFNATVSYTASGQVYYCDDGKGVEGVTISFSGDYSSVQTDYQGNWSKSGLSGTVTVIPSLTGWDFYPQSISVSSSNRTANFDATPKPGTLKWSNTEDFGGPIKSSPAIDNNGYIVFGCDDQYMYWVNPSTGKIDYYSFLNYPIQASPAIGTDGEVYIGDNGGNLYRIESIPGANSIVSYSSDASPTIGDDGTVYFFINNRDESGFALSSTLVTYNTYSGFKEQAQMEFSVSGSPAMGYNGYLYVVDGGAYGPGCLLEINPYTYQTNMLYEVGSSIWTSPAIGDDHIVYFSATDGYVYAIDPYYPNSYVWRAYVNGALSPIIGLDGRIYVTTTDGKLYALSPSSGYKDLIYTTEAQLDLPVVGDDGYIYVGSEDGYFYCIDPDSETVVWEKYVGKVYASPVIRNGVVYVVSENGIYAFYCDAVGLASTSWPKFRHDNKNTGRACY